jgi:hypothetical protein
MSRPFRANSNIVDPTDPTDPSDPSDPTDPSDLLSVSRPCKVRVKSVWVAGDQSAPSLFVWFVVKKWVVGGSPRQAFS